MAEELLCEWDFFAVLSDVDDHDVLVLEPYWHFQTDAALCLKVPLSLYTLEFGSVLQSSLGNDCNAREPEIKEHGYIFPKKSHAIIILSKFSIKFISSQTVPFFAYNDILSG